MELVSSTVLELEVSQNSLPIRREHGLQVLNHAMSIVIIDESRANRAKEFVQHGVKAIDAFHLAAAEGAGTDYFVTCDDRFLRRATSFPGLRMTVITPIELIRILES
jgi:predicted nucleic acid-binding protein